MRRINSAEDPSEEHNLGSVQSPAGDDGKGDIFPVGLQAVEVCC